MMVYDIRNVPLKGENIRIECTPNKNGDFIVHTSNGREICRISSCTQEGFADDIAKIMTRMRDIGFEQERRHVRLAIGLDD